MEVMSAVKVSQTANTGAGGGDLQARVAHYKSKHKEA